MNYDPKLVEQVRLRIKNSRELKTKDLVISKIAWSKRASRRNRFIRWLFSLPSKPYTEEQALNQLKIDAKGSVMSALASADMIGWQAENICDALETAHAYGLPLKLTVSEVDELREWL